MPIPRRPSLRRHAIAFWLAWVAGVAIPFSAQETAAPPTPPETDLPKNFAADFRSLSRTEAGDYVFTKATVTWRDSRIQADRLTLREERFVEAEGNVLIAWAGNYIFGSRMEYDLETERGVLENASGQVESEYLFQAAKAEKIGEDRVHLVKATVTTCTQPVPYWSFSVSSATIRIEHYARMWNVRLRAGKLPVVYLPYLIWPVKEDRAVGLLMPEFHTTQNRGRAMSQELFIPLGRSADLTLLGRYYTEAGFGGGGELRFVPNSRGSAQFNGFYIQDKVEDDTGRYRASYGQTQQFQNGFRMVADINLVSDFDYYTDFERELDLITSPTILARLEFSRNGPWTSINVRELRRKQLFSGGKRLIQQTLPEIEWRGRERQLGKTPFYLSYQSSVASIQKRTLIPPPDEDQDPDTPVELPIDADYRRFDLFPTITLPYSPRPWIDITPLIRYRWTYYSQSERDLEDNNTEILDDSLTRGLFGAGLEIVGPKLFRVYEAKEGSHPRHKHSIEPRISYVYGEAFDRRDDVILYDEVDRFSGAGNGMNYAIVQRFFAERPRTEPAPATAGPEAIVMPDGTTSAPRLDPNVPGAPPLVPEASETPPPREPVEIATIELRQARSFDEDLSGHDLDGDQKDDLTSRSSPIQFIGRFNPSETTSVDLRSSYDIIFDEFSDVTISGSLRRKLARIRFSVVHRNALVAHKEDDTQLRLTTGFSAFRGKLRVDLDGSFDYDPPDGQKHVPDKRWRVQYSTQCCTFLFEQLTREFSSGTDRRDFYFRVDLKGIGKILDVNY